MPINPEPNPPAGDRPAPGVPPAVRADGTPPDGLGLTRVTFSKPPHRFEFRCERGDEAVLARAVLDLAHRPGSPLEPGDAFTLCRQIESLAAAGSSGLPGAQPAPRRKAA